MMFDPNHSQHNNAARQDTGASASGNQQDEVSPVEGDSPTHGTVEGPLAAQSSPRDEEAQPTPESEGRPTEDDPRKSDGIAEFKKMEAHAEAGRE
jgi:hypothetical protein